MEQSDKPVSHMEVSQLLVATAHLIHVCCVSICVNLGGRRCTLCVQHVYTCGPAL